VIERNWKAKEDLTKTQASVASLAAEEKNLKYDKINTS